MGELYSVIILLVYYFTNSFFSPTHYVVLEMSYSLLIHYLVHEVFHLPHFPLFLHPFTHRLTYFKHSFTITKVKRNIKRTSLGTELLSTFNLTVHPFSH